MSAGNFHKTEATKYFAVCMTTVDEETNEAIYPESWEFSDIRQDVVQLLEAKGYKVYTQTTLRDEHELRSYCSHIIGRIDKGDVDIMLTTRSGYYEGACLDYHQTSSVFDEELQNDTKKEQKRIEAFRKRYTKDHAKLIKDIEAVYAQISTPLICVARASNGEAFYQQSN